MVGMSLAMTGCAMKRLREAELIEYNPYLIYFHMWELGTSRRRQIVSKLFCKFRYSRITWMVRPPHKSLTPNDGI
jgi:hypothetical protein